MIPYNLFKQAFRYFEKTNPEGSYSEEAKVLKKYRYSSLVLISAAYLINGPQNTFLLKAGVIVFFTISSKYIANLYIKYSKNKSHLMILIIIETISINLILLPTGGLASPFIWYATNLTLVVVCYLNYYYSWGNLVLFLGTGLLIDFFAYNSKNLSILDILRQNSIMILVFILINIVVQQLSSLSKKLQALNLEKEKSMEYIMSLYQVVEALNNHSCKDSLFDVILSFTSELTQNDSCLIWLRENDLIKFSNSIGHDESEKVLARLKEIKKERVTQTITIVNQDYLTIPILSSFEFYGIIAVVLKGKPSIKVLEQYRKLLKFIADLSAVTLERFKLEAIEDNLIVMDEQNRIADEMHDSVSQRLFSISYGLHGVLGRLDTISVEELSGYLEELKQSSNTAMNELRNSIYKLSSDKNGEKYFQSTIQLFLDSIVKIYNVNTKFIVEGEERLLPPQYKQGLTRIIKEACGNAIRHGRCKNILINLTMHDDMVALSIEDDGCGFSVDLVNSNSGLGLNNMSRLVSSFNGKFNIRSIIEKGTEIQIVLPTVQLQANGGGLSI